MGRSENITRPQSKKHIATDAFPNVDPVEDVGYRVYDWKDSPYVFEKPKTNRRIFSREKART